MSYSGGIIYPTVRLRANDGDIEQAVGHTSGNLETLIRQGNINMWAKYKPVRLSDQNTLYDWNGSAWRDNSTWWKGNDGKCGIDISVYYELGSPNSQNTFLYYLKNGQLGWTYNRPRGSAYNEPFRQTDFAYYNAGARNPLGSIGSTDIWLPNNNVLEIGFDLSPSQYGLSLFEISINSVSLSQFYMGVLMWSGNIWNCVTSYNQLGGASAMIRIADASSLVGTWHIVPFFSNREYPIGSNFQTGTYLSANVNSPITITIHKAGTLYEVVAIAWWSSSNVITFEPIVYNHDSGTRTLSNVTVEIHTTTSPDPSGSTFISGTRISYGSVSVSGNSYVTLSQRTVNVSRNGSLYYWAIGYADGVSANTQQVDEDSSIMPDI